MNITIKYRRVGLTQKQHLLNCVNPSPLIQKNGLRVFYADTDVVGTTDIDLLFTESLYTPPNENWELHSVEISELKLFKFNPYKT
jgi:hypothetical protein